MWLEPAGFADRLQGQPAARPRLLCLSLRGPCRPLHPAIQDQLRVQQVMSSTSRPARSAKLDICTGDWVVGSPSAPDNATQSVGTTRFGPAITVAFVGCIGSVGMVCAATRCSGLGTVAAATPSLEAASDRSVESACPAVALRSGECFTVGMADPDGGVVSPYHAGCCPPSAVPMPATVSRRGRTTPSDGMT